MSHRPWWTWEWDARRLENPRVPYVSIDRWRRGWVTLYRFQGIDHVEWRLYLPFNVSVGVQT